MRFIYVIDKTISKTYNPTQPPLPLKYHHPNTALSRRLAATKIQASFKAFSYNKQYKLYRKKRWAAGVIAISWVMYVRMAKMKRRLTTSRQSQISYHNNAITKIDWEKFENKKVKKCIIHLPSLSYQPNVRLTMEDIKIKQARQFGRMTDIFREDVEKVIFISPLELSHEIISYWKAIIDIRDPKMFNKIQFVKPEALSSFPTHNMSLATLMKYSSEALTEIKKIIQPYTSTNRCYIQPGTVSIDDLAVSTFLDCPILAPKWETVDKFSHSKSNIKKALIEAGLEVPPCRLEIKTIEGLSEALADLIVKNPTNLFYLIKINNNIDGRGVLRLRLDSSTLDCYDWLQKETLKFKEQWKFPWAHETALNRLYRVLPDVIKTYSVCQNNDLIKNNQTYPTWASFEKDMNQFGCILEVEADNADIAEVTAITVDCFVSGGGNGKGNKKENQIKTLITGDQIHAGNHLQHWGSTIPQCSIENEKLQKSVDKILKYLIEKEDFFGHISLDFLTFYDDNDEQKLWAIDFKFGISNQLAMYQIGDELTKGGGGEEPRKPLYMALLGSF